jgi:hypothetical protein
MTTRRGYEEMKHRYILRLFAGGEEAQGPFASLTHEVDAIAENQKTQPPRCHRGCLVSDTAGGARLAPLRDAVRS